MGAVARTAGVAFDTDGAGDAAIEGEGDTVTDAAPAADTGFGATDSAPTAGRPALPGSFHSDRPNPIAPPAAARRCREAPG